MSATIELVLGGARSGKSDWAVCRARDAGSEVLFIATAEAGDEEMRARIAAHRGSRPQHWRTLEEPHDPAARLRALRHDYDVAIVDCLTFLVSNWLLAGALGPTSAAPLETPGRVGVGTAGTDDEVGSRVVDLCRALRSRAARTILVSNEVGSGVVPESALGRRFRDELGAANRVAAAQADRVVLLVAGQPLLVKGKS